MANVHQVLTKSTRFHVSRVTSASRSPIGTLRHITEANAHGNLWRGFENFLDRP